MSPIQPFAIALLSPLLAGCTTSMTVEAVHQAGRSHFLGITDFSAFSRAAGSNIGEVLLTSPEIAAPIDWNELVPSWNTTPDTCLTVEARAISDAGTTRFYSFGQWSLDPARCPRSSVTGQRDADGEVKTDELVLKRLARRVQVRLTLRTFDVRTVPRLKYLGLSFFNNTVSCVPQPPNRPAWGKTIPVPEKGQLDYAGGRDWCSPTCVSMVLSHWANVLHRPELDVAVPDAARQIDDPAWRGTGNWPFNTALAGSFEGMRASLSRFDGLPEVEHWIAAGLPVVLSVSFDRLNGGNKDEGTGHLVVCVGFTVTGDVVVNDPWAPKKEGLRIHRVYPRQHVIDAWARSQNTVYLIYPESARTPPNRWGHW
jgi:hypothetical protein